MNLVRTTLLLHVTAAVSLVAAPLTLTVTTTDLPILYGAVGTITPRIEADVAAQASGRLLTLDVQEGDTVTRGQRVATIEDNQLLLQLSQSRSGLEGAEAQRLQAEYGRVGAMAGAARAEAEYERVKKMHVQKAATDQQLEQADATFKQAQSAVAGADEGVKAAAAAVRRATAAMDEVKVALGYAKVTAPFDGVVTRRLADVGDLAWPGRPLVHLISPTAMRVEAHVREGLTGHVSKGLPLQVTVDALELTIEGTVEEIVPIADPTSRTFVVKVALPNEPRLLPGMFARLSIPTGVRRTVVVPKRAVTHLGQLSVVSVKDGDLFVRRLVRTGDDVKDGLEILSGLRAGETVALPSVKEVRDDR